MVLTGPRLAGAWASSAGPMAVKRAVPASTARGAGPGTLRPPRAPGSSPTSSWPDELCRMPSPAAMSVGPVPQPGLHADGPVEAERLPGGHDEQELLGAPAGDLDRDAHRRGVAGDDLEPAPDQPVGRHLHPHRHRPSRDVGPVVRPRHPEGRGRRGRGRGGADDGEDGKARMAASAVRPSRRPGQRSRTSGPLLSPATPQVRRRPQAAGSRRHGENRGGRPRRYRDNRCARDRAPREPVPARGQTAGGSGRCCSMVRTGSNRSPCSATRSRTAGRLEHEGVGVAAGRGPVHLVPRHGGGHRRPGTGPQE